MGSQNSHVELVLEHLPESLHRFITYLLLKGVIHAEENFLFHVAECSPDYIS